MKEKGERFNQGKLRYDLLNPIATEGLVKVLTKGAEKYAPRNWEKGLPWTEVIASLKRHLAAIEKGEDFDSETGLLHIDHVQCNAHFLSTFYKTAPHFDDRNHNYLKVPKIGLDIDEVICDWVGGWIEKRGIKERPHSWLFDRHIASEFDKMEQEGSLHDFMLSMKPLVDPKEIPFEPHCYITARRIPNEISQKWIDDNKFPTAPVYTVPPNTSKVDIAKQAGVDIFIDDNYKNFVELTNAGIFTYLYDAPHNKRYDVGHKRLYSLKDLKF